MQNSKLCPSCQSTNSTSHLQTVDKYKILECGNCQLRFVPIDTVAEIVDYDDLYQEEGLYQDKFVHVDGKDLPAFPSRTRRNAFKMIRDLKPDKVLEIGCGTGGFLAQLENLGVECYGVEGSGNAVEVARGHLKATILNELFSKESFKNHSFDVICIWEVFEHVHDIQDFISCASDLLKPGGFLFMSTPNYQSQWMWADMPRDPMSAPPVHVTFWNKYALRKFLDDYFPQNDVYRYSAPIGAALRSGYPLAKWIVYLDALVRPKNRTTLMSVSQKSF